MDDSELVQSARSGDAHALAAIYDRYTDRIHDFAYATLRDRGAVADVVQETFAVAFERLDRLADPSRLGPWLYAIAHHAAIKRAADQKPREDITVVLPGATRTFPVASTPPPEEASRAELAEFVWQASSELTSQERALLDLDLRQGLHGNDLADAVGLTPPHLATTLNRLLAQVERSLGALLVARSIRRDCPRLAEILGASDGVLTPKLRSQITSHVDDCETCNSRRRMVLNPLGLLAGVAVVPTPASLRRVVLDRSQAVGAGDWIFDADGFPYQGGDRRTAEVPAIGSPATTVMATPAPRPDPVPAFTRVDTYRPTPEPFGPDPTRNHRGILIGALAGVIIVIGGILALATGRGHKAVPVAAGVSTTAAPVTTALTTVTTQPAPTTTKPQAPTTVPPGHFIVGAKSLDFGATGLTQSLVVGNDGAGPLTFTATAPNAALTISPANGTIDSAAKATLTVTLDRTTASPGPFSTTIAISSASGSAIVAVSAEIDPGPMITLEVTVPPEICVPTTGTASATVTAHVTTSIPLTADGVRLHSRPPTGTEKKMALTGSTATGTLGPYTAVPSMPIEWWITATDTQGLSTSTVHHFLNVAVC